MYAYISSCPETYKLDLQAIAFTEAAIEVFDVYFRYDLILVLH